MSVIASCRGARAGRVSRVLLWAGILAASAAAFVMLAVGNPQSRNMHAVEEWLRRAETASALAAFQQAEGLTFRVFTNTRQQGTVGVLVEGESARRGADILAFVVSLAPPRPVEVMARLPGGPTQSFRSEDWAR